MLIDFNRGAVDVFGERSGVTANRGLSVADVIARHQARQRLQDGIVRNYVALARMEQHFRPTAADPGYDVVSQNRYFVAGIDVEWEELSFFVNGSRWGADRPPFPLLQPEKVLSLPLQLRFDETYRYRLDGTAKVAGYDCYVVRFDPVRSDRRAAEPSGSIRRPSRASASRPCKAECPPPSCPTRRSRSTPRRWMSTGSPCTCSTASTPGRSC
jgi:hypothetical protein